MMSLQPYRPPRLRAIAARGQREEPPAQVCGRKRATKGPLRPDQPFEHCLPQCRLTSGDFNRHHFH